MSDYYEKLGAFYLGKEYDLATHTLKEDIVLYDSKDLNTHAVIIGITGSGKTGLGIGLLEEALIDNIESGDLDAEVGVVAFGSVARSAKRAVSTGGGTISTRSADTP